MSRETDCSFTFKESDLKNLIGTSNLQSTLREVVGEMKTMKSWVEKEISEKFAEADKKIEKSMKEADRAVEAMRAEVLEDSKRALEKEIKKVHEMVGQKLAAVSGLQEEVKELRQAQSEMGECVEQLQQKAIETDNSLKEALVLVEGACVEARDARKVLDATVKEQLQERASMQARVSTAESAARSAEQKADEAQASVLDARDDLEKIQGELPTITKDLQKVADCSERNELAHARLESTLTDLKSRVDSELSGISDTLDAARCMQSQLSTEMVRLQEAAKEASSGLDTIRAEQQVGLRKITDRIDRNEGMMKLKANHNDLVRLLGSKADRDVIDSLSSERNKFLREVNSKMNDVENQVCDKADRQDVQGFVKEKQVQDLLQQQASDITTFVTDTIAESVDGVAHVSDCEELQKKIEKVTGEVVTLTEAESEKVNARLAALRSQLSKKADTKALKKMDAKIHEVAHATMEDSSSDAAGLFFRCLSCDTKLPKLRGREALETLGGMLPPQPVAPVMGQLLDRAEYDDGLKEFLTNAMEDHRPASASLAAPNDFPNTSTGRRLLLTGSDGRLYKGAFADDVDTPPGRSVSPSKNLNVLSK